MIGLHIKDTKERALLVTIYLNFYHILAAAGYNLGENFIRRAHLQVLKQEDIED
jgi:hypothetical protein